MNLNENIFQGMIGTIGFFSLAKGNYQNFLNDISKLICKNSFVLDKLLESITDMNQNFSKEEISIYEEFRQSLIFFICPQMILQFSKFLPNKDENSKINNLQETYLKSIGSVEAFINNSPRNLFEIIGGIDFFIAFINKFNKLTTQQDFETILICLLNVIFQMLIQKSALLTYFLINKGRFKRIGSALKILSNNFQLNFSFLDWYNKLVSVLFTIPYLTEYKFPFIYHILFNLKCFSSSCSKEVIV